VKGVEPEEGEAGEGRERGGRGEGIDEREGRGYRRQRVESNTLATPPHRRGGSEIEDLEGDQLRTARGGRRERAREREKGREGGYLI
jgi:hypothetical protein